MGLPASGGVTEGSGNGGDTEVHNMEAEHDHTIYFDATNYVTMRSGHSADSSAGVSAVVGEGRN